MDVLGLGLIGPFLSILLDGRSQTLSAFFQIFTQNIGISNTFHNQILIAGLIIILIYFSKMIIAIFTIIKINSFSNFQIVRIRTDLMKNYLKLPYQKFISKNKAKYIYLINDLTRNFSLLIIKPILKMISDIIMIVFIVSFLVYFYGFEIVVLGTILFFGMSTYYLLFSKRQLKYGVEANKSADRVIRSIGEGLAGIRELRVMGIQNLFSNSFKKHSFDFANNNNNAQIIAFLPKIIIEFLLLFSLILLILVYLFLGYTAPQLVAAMGVLAVASIRLLPAFSSITNTILSLRYHKNTVDLLFEDLKQLVSNEFKLDDKGVQNAEFNNLRLLNVSFSYFGNNKEVISNSSIEIKKGQTIGITGKSGSGKTTLIDIILGLLPPSKGNVSINGMESDKSSLIDNMNTVYVPQESFFIDGTIIENITLALEKDEIDLDLMHKSVELAELAEEIKKLESGLNTRVGPDGVRLSGGQRQRIIIARAIYSDRDILLLDEATSAIDEETENKILNNLKKFKKNMTIIIISHRPKIIEYCDRIYRLKDGKITEN